MKAIKSMRRATLLALAAVLLFPFGLSANNIRIVGTPAVAKKNDSIAAITFTVAWDNSWKSSKPANYDAAWIYVKCWDGDQWNHAYLADTGHTPGNNDLPGYRVTNREGTKKKFAMTYELGKSVVYKQWHVDPDEDSVIGNVGLFLYRKDSLGAGDVVVPGVSLLWNYAEQGFTSDDDLVVKVFAVEMVYVPQGEFYLGGMGTQASQPASFTANSNKFGFPYYVASEKAITVANNASDTTLWSTAGMVAGTLSADFPKGYQAFYIMKYELTQEAYADFLNTLNQGQQDGRIQGVLANIGVGGHIWDGAANSLAAWRNYIEVSQRAPTVVFSVDANNNNKWNETTTVARTVGGVADSCAMGIDGQDVAVNFVSMYDLLAYADFAGLRPMTELEYEKACRGNRPVVNDEYAWGSVTMTYFNTAFHDGWGAYFGYSTARIPDINKGSEHVADDYNCGATHGIYYVWWENNRMLSAPLRVGCFADSTSTRAAAGATYWGVMNMSDNCSELCISVGNATVAPGQKFIGVHGDGQLLANGNADVTGWAIVDVAPYYIPRGMTFPSGVAIGNVGWGYNGLAGQVLTAGMISSRYQYAHGYIPSRRDTHGAFMPGIRCVRTAKAAK